MTAISKLTGKARSAGRLILAGILWIELPIIVLWLALALALSRVTDRVVDWFVMTDELPSERLAISVAACSIGSIGR